jgi:ankyrin repeat protein
MGALLKAGADINQRNLVGFTPLHQAAKRGAYATGRDRFITKR